MLLSNYRGLKVNVLIKPSGQACVQKLNRDTMNDVRSAYAGGNNTFKKLLSNMAEVESSTALGYRGRYIFELLQNANDAIQDARESNSMTRTKPYRVRIELTKDALIVANDGVPFQEKDVDSIHQWGESSKDPNKSIGYKGIGFKSVLEITEAPQIYSSIVQFHFNKILCYQQVQEFVGKDVALKLPFTYFVFPYSIEEIISDDRKKVEQLLNGDGYDTVIRLPLLPNINHDDVIDQIKKDVDPALLLFLGGIDEIDIWIRGKRLERLHRKLEITDEDVPYRLFTLYRSRRITSRWMVFEAPRIPIENRDLIDSLKQDSWKRVKEVGFSIAYRLDENRQLVVHDQSEPIYVYFPTKIQSDLGIRIHADFFVDANRKSIEAFPFNLWLANQIADYIAEIIIPTLAQKYPHEPAVIQSMIPLSEPVDFAAYVLDAIHEQLKTCEFIPSQIGKAVTPKETLFMPDGVFQELESLEKFFPAKELLKICQGYFFAANVLYENRQVVDFLLNLGAKQLSFSEVFASLNGRDPTSSESSYAEFYQFLWSWHERLDYRIKHDMSSSLGESHFIVNRQRNWIKPYERLFHSKLRQDTPDIPNFLQVDVVHPEAYDSEGRTGATFKLLSSLTTRVREYDAEPIIRNSIMPLFEGRKFKRLQVPERTAIYKYLFDYWKDRRGGNPDIDQMVKDVKVNAKWISNRHKWVWKKISEVYLPAYWTNDDRLEKLFWGMEGIAFLYEIKGLDLDDKELVEWSNFWQWMGASISPRIITEELSREETKNHTWYHFYHYHKHSNLILWPSYINYIKQFSYCQNHGQKYLKLWKSATIDRLGELIEFKDVDRLSLLFELLNEHWSKYEKYSKINLKCYRKGCNERSRSLQSHWLFVLKYSEWIPAYSTRGGGTDIGLKQPNQCWFVPPTENAVARIMLPTPILQTDIRFMDKRRYYRDLGMRFLDEVEVDDLLDILRELPDQYPDPNISISTGRRRIPRAVGTLTRWIFGRIFNLLSQQETKSERIEARIPIVATDENQLRYIYPPEPVFFAGDRYHSPRWKAYLPFAPLDENWRDVAEYLGITLLSENVHERVNPGTILPEETNTLIRNFKNARPYMLAVVNSQRASATEDAIRYLTNLDIQVVDSLVVNRELTLEEGKIIPDADARIYLEETTIQRVGSAGRAQRAGVLYIRHGYERNYDLMGAPIAEYLRIPGLADAFVILLDRGGKEGKMRYLDTRQIFERDVAEMRKNLSLTGVLDAEDQDVIQDIDDHEMNNHLMRELKKELEQDTSGEELEGDDIVDDDQEASDEELTENDGDQPDERVEEANKGLVFPALVIDDVKSFPVNTENSVRPSGGEKSLRNKRNDYRWFGSWENNQKLKDAYGKRGEEVVYLLEIKRLSNLGITNPEGEVHWLREEGRPTANHDIESLDLDYGNLVPILIEVKATPGNDFRVYMSKEELLCARKNGCNYRLHRVIDITSPSPKEYIFENPYTLWKKGLAIIEPRDTYVILPDPDIDKTIEER